MDKIKLGKKGEGKARRYLKGKGFKIVESNYKNPFGEVDIIAERGDLVAFVEVKTRLSDEYGTPSEAVDLTRRRRYIRAAEYYVSTKDYRGTVRFDVIEIYRGKLNHIENAFSVRS